METPHGGRGAEFASPNALEANGGATTDSDSLVHVAQESDDVTNDVNNFSVRTQAEDQKAFLDEVKRFELFRGVIQHEDSLLNERVSWIILAQSFLMAAFITADESKFQKYTAAFVGLATVVVTMPAIFAAGRNIELQQTIYFRGISSDRRCIQLHGHARDLSLDFPKEQRDRLHFGHIFPNMAFRGRGSVPILFTVLGLALVQCLGWSFLLIALAKDW